MAIITLQGDVEKRNRIRYQFESTDAPIGEGGMGKVYKGVCIDEKSGFSREVAIKFMYDGLPENAYERARRESEIQLRNDNLIEMLGFIELEEKRSDGSVIRRCHVVSELLDGISLYDLLKGKTTDRDGHEFPFAVKMQQDMRNAPERFATMVVKNVLSGLMALHDAGYIHRDIDPSNIFLTSDGRIKLIDFGIAKQMNTLTTNDKALTVAGNFMGKPEYAAPELVIGDIKSQNQTTDIYAVGILLYQCIVGHTPFEGARHEILDKQLKSKLPINNIKSKALRDIIATACNKKQGLRYQTAAQMRVALETTNGKQPKKVVSRNKLMIAVAAAVLVVSSLGGVTYLVKQKNDKAEAEAIAAKKTQHITEVRLKVEQILLEAEQFSKAGCNKEQDNYESKLISAYNTYGEAQKIAGEENLAVFSASEVAGKRKALLTRLDSARIELINQANMLLEIGEVELAKTYQDRAKVIEKFRKVNQ